MYHPSMEHGGHKNRKWNGEQTGLLRIFQTLFPQDLEITRWSYILTNSNWKRDLQCNIRSSTVYKSQDLKATIISSDRWMHKHDVACAKMGKIRSIKYDEIMSVVANSKDPEILRLSQLILTEEERDHMVSLVRGISKGTQGNSVWKQTQTHRLGRPNQHSWRPNSQGGPNQLTSIAIYTLIGVNIRHFLDLV